MREETLHLVSSLSEQYNDLKKGVEDLRTKICNSETEKDSHDHLLEEQSTLVNVF